MSDTIKEEGELALDPFDPQNLPVVQLITQLRIYDVLMGIYKELDSTKARQLLDAHYNGDIVGSFPRLSGKFITDLVNVPEDQDKYQ